MKAKLKLLEVFFTMHLLFVNYVVFANFVDQIGYPYNILYMTTLQQNIEA
jgi:hypothetical protein